MTESRLSALAQSSTTVHLYGSQVWAIAEVKDKSALTLSYPLRGASCQESGSLSAFISKFLILINRDLR